MDGPSGIVTPDGKPATQHASPLDALHAFLTACRRKTKGEGDVRASQHLGATVALVLGMNNLANAVQAVASHCAAGLVALGLANDHPDVAALRTMGAPAQNVELGEVKYEPPATPSPDAPADQEDTKH